MRMPARRLHVARSLAACALLPGLALGCATTATRTELVRDRAEFDLGCPAAQIRVRELDEGLLEEQIWGGSFVAEGCGSSLEYELSNCGLGAAENGCEAIARTGAEDAANSVGDGAAVR